MVEQHVDQLVLGGGQPLDGNGHLSEHVERLTRDAGRVDGVAGAGDLPLKSADVRGCRHGRFLWRRLRWPGQIAAPASTVVSGMAGTAESGSRLRP